MFKKCFRKSKQISHFLFKPQSSSCKPNAIEDAIKTIKGDPKITPNAECKELVIDRNEVLNRNIHKVNKLERKFLLWTNSRYKTEDEIPSYVTNAAMEKARNKIRIFIMNLMMLATVLGSFAMIMVGKNARNRGETLQKQNLDWHVKLKEDYYKSQKK